MGTSVTRSLGKSGLSFKPLVLGGNVFDWTADVPTSLRIISAFVERGFSAIDTADVYSTWVAGHQGGESESVIGQWLRDGGARDNLLIMTKVGMPMPGGRGLSRAHILASCEASLRRLNTDHIDLYQAHMEDVATPLEETLGAFQTLIEQGKVRAIGASNYTALKLAEARGLSKAFGLPNFTALQPNYSLVNRKLFEGSVQKFCLEENLGVISYRALAAGFLTGKYRKPADFAGKPRENVLTHVCDPRSLDILNEMDKIAARLNITLAQIAIAWVLAQKGITAPIVSATDLKQLDEVLGAVDVNLDAAALSRLDRVSA